MNSKRFYQFLKLVLFFTVINLFKLYSSVQDIEYSTMQKILNEDSRIIFDIGANVGEWTKLANRCSPNAKIYAFEPFSPIFRILKKQNRLNPNVNCFQYAVSNKDGFANLNVWLGVDSINKSELNSLFYRPGLEQYFKHRPSAVKIETITLDTFCEQNSIEEIDYLKIDTEGNEWFVLLGANKMISGNLIKVIQFEYGGTYLDSNTSLKSIY